MTDTSIRVVSLIERVGRMLQSCHVGFGEEERSLTINQVILLKALSSAGRMAMADIAQALRITPASATSLVNRMVKSAWLERSDDPSDRRKIWVSIPASRLERWHALEDQHRAAMVKFNGVLSQEEQHQLAAILETLISRNS